VYKLHSHKLHQHLCNALPHWQASHDGNEMMQLLAIWLLPMLLLKTATS